MVKQTYGYKWICRNPEIDVSTSDVCAGGSKRLPEGGGNSNFEHPNFQYRRYQYWVENIFLPIIYFFFFFLKS